MLRMQVCYCCRLVDIITASSQHVSYLTLVRWIQAIWWGHMHLELLSCVIHVILQKSCRLEHTRVHLSLWTHSLSPVLYLAFSLSMYISVCVIARGVFFLFVFLQSNAFFPVFSLFSKQDSLLVSASLHFVLVHSLSCKGQHFNMFWAERSSWRLVCNCPCFGSSHQGF